jgi:ABC-type Fe3+ transport system permease subunit
LELVALILMWIFVITLFIGLFLHPKTRETIRMANKESATKLKKYLRIFLIIVLVFIVIIAILLLLGIFTDFVIIEVE